jgi:hypothetical protein
MSLTAAGENVLIEILLDVLKQQESKVSFTTKASDYFFQFYNFSSELVDKIQIGKTPISHVQPWPVAKVFQYKIIRSHI